MALTQVKTSGIADDAVTLAKQAAGTDGNIISYDASGNPVAIATGSDGQVLTSTGAGSPPAFEAPAVTALNNATANELVTVGSTTTELDAEANLTYDGTTLTSATAVQVQGGSGDTTLKLHRTNAAGSNGNHFGSIRWTDNNNNEVSSIRGERATAVDDANLTFYTRTTGGSAAERLRITSAGLVGIGLDSPSSYSSGANNLVVNDASGAGGITIVTPDDEQGSIFFSDGTGATGRGRIRYNHTNDSLNFGTSNTENKLIIDSNGYVTKPSQPFFHAKGAAAWVAIDDADGNVDCPFSVEITDIGNNYNHSNYTFTAPVAGKYVFHVMLYWKTNTNNGYFQNYFTVNNGISNERQHLWGYGTGAPHEDQTSEATLAINLAANDYVRFRLNVGGVDGDFYGGHSSFSGYLLQ